MKQLLVFIKKEFYHVFRDRRTLLILFGLPIAQILLFGLALTSEVRNVKMIIIDNAKDINAQQLINKIKASDIFIVEETTPYTNIEKAFQQGEIRCAVLLPHGFGNDLVHLGKVQLQIITDGSDPNTAKILISYLTAIIADYQQQISSIAALPYVIIPEKRVLYNKEGNGSLDYIPGVVALILMIVCTSLTSVSVVREKELGTMEILLVSPFKPVLVLIAKAIPYLFLSLINFTVILLLSVFVLHVHIQGSVTLLFLESTLFVISCLSFGLLISNTTNSQQVALLISMMGMMIPTVIFTGFLLPLESMPTIFQYISKFIPSHWYYLIVKSIMLKGLGFGYVWKETLILLIMTIVLLGFSLKNFKIRLS